MCYARRFRPHPALTRHLPHPGEGFFGGTLLYVVPLNNGDPACWRPAWGGVRLRGNDWWSRVNIGGWCRFAQDDTVGDRGAVPNMFGANVSPACPPSSGASRHLPPRRGRLFRWCVALCNTSQQWRSRPTPSNEPSGAKGKILRRHPKPRLEPPSGKVPRIPKLHRKGHPKTQYVSPRTTSAGVLCGEVLGVLRTFSERRF